MNRKRSRVTGLLVLVFATTVTGMLGAQRQKKGKVTQKGCVSSQTPIFRIQDLDEEKGALGDGLLGELEALTLLYFFELVHCD